LHNSLIISQSFIGVHEWSCQDLWRS